MSYEHIDEKRASDPYALPDVEIFEDTRIDVDCCCGIFHMGQGEFEGRIDSQRKEKHFLCPSCEDYSNYTHVNTGINDFWYSYGMPGYMWESGPYGPFETYSIALEQAREDSGVYDREDRYENQKTLFKSNHK